MNGSWMNSGMSGSAKGAKQCNGTRCWSYTKNRLNDLMDQRAFVISVACNPHLPRHKRPSMERIFASPPLHCQPSDAPVIE